MTNRTRALIVLLVMSCLPFNLARSQDAPAYQAPGPLGVTETLGEWHDQRRDRDLPYKIWAPEGDGPFPVIVFSHGLGGSREGYAFQGRHWATHGFVSVHLQHLGSDDSVWRDVPPAERMTALAAAKDQAKNALNRLGDVRFAVDSLTAMNDGDGPFARRLDLAHLGMAGHSFGAWTTQMTLGQSVILRERVMSYGDERFIAGVIESPNYSGRNLDDLDRIYGSIDVPALHLTGTIDGDPFDGDFDPTRRTIPYQHITAAPQYLVVFEGGDHMVFSGRTGTLGGRNPTKDERFHELTLAATTAFWKAYLQDDAAARAWLTDGYPEWMGEDGTFAAKVAEG